MSLSGAGRRRDSTDGPQLARTEVNEVEEVEEIVGEAPALPWEVAEDDLVASQPPTDWPPEEHRPPPETIWGAV